jgi:hypothetical protein
MTMCINRTSTIFGIAFWIIKGRWYDMYPCSKFWLTVMAISLVLMLLPHKNKYQRSINDYRSWNLFNPRTVLWHLPIIEVLPGYMDNMSNVDVSTVKNECEKTVNRVSTKYQWVYMLHLVWFKGFAIVFTQSRCIAGLYKQYVKCQCHYT